MGKECSDFDFTARKVQDIARHFANETRSPCVPLDETPGRETFRVILEKQFTFDFTEMQGASIEVDLAQRDFSINAMAMRLKDFLEGKNTLIDPNQGLSDLNAKTVRVIPGPIFSSDPCRMLRAFRFAATLNFKIESETLQKIDQEKANLIKTASERIYHEWILFLGGQRVFPLLQLMDTTGLLECVLPETGELRDTGAFPATAWETGMETFNCLESLLSEPEAIFQNAGELIIFSGRDFALLKFAALLFQLVPPSSESHSTPMRKVEGVFERLRASNADIQFMVIAPFSVSGKLWIPIWSLQGTALDESKIYRFVKKNTAQLMSGLYLACAVKSTFKKGDGPKINEFKQAVCRIGEFYWQRYLPAKDQSPLLNGNDLIGQFKLSPSPLFQIVLDRVEESRVLGSIRSKSEAESLARNIIESQ